MGEVHQLILDIGVENARQLAFDKVGRQCVDAAFCVMSDENFDIGITHAGFAITALPHKPFPDRVWERSGGKNGEITLRIESGSNRSGDMVGIPSGSIARLILFHLSSEAYVNNSRVVELGSSMRAFLLRMGISPGGKTLKIVREQSRRIALCRLTFFNEGKKNTMVSNGSFIRNALLGNTQDERTPFWQDTVELDEGFFNSLRDHPLPVREAAIRQSSRDFKADTSFLGCTLCSVWGRRKRKEGFRKWLQRAPVTRSIRLSGSQGRAVRYRSHFVSI